MRALPTIASRAAALPRGTSQPGWQLKRSQSPKLEEPRVMSLVVNGRSALMRGRKQAVAGMGAYSTVSVAEARM